MEHAHVHGADFPEEESKGHKFVLSILITSLTLVAEIIGGILTGSLALLSDAAHVFLDIFALALSYGAVRLAARAPSGKHSYGFRRMKVLAAFVNGATLLAVSVEIFREAVVRLFHPSSVIALPMLIIAVIGLAANLLVAFVLRGHDHGDINTRSAFLHVLGDALSSVGVIVAGVVILFTGWTWVDPAAGILISIIILFGAWRILKEVVHILNEGAPEGASAAEVAAAMAAVPGVVEIHDVHVWAIEANYRVMSAHVVLSDKRLSETNLVMDALKEIAAHKFDIEHTTIQFECANCGQGPVSCRAEGENA
jgi:cobalt-zinc-cadmium efflux system protein